MLNFLHELTLGYFVTKLHSPNCSRRSDEARQKSPKRAVKVAKKSRSPRKQPSRGKSVIVAGMKYTILFCHLQGKF